jgi:hypothetical protein
MIKTLVLPLLFSFAAAAEPFIVIDGFPIEKVTNQLTAPMATLNFAKSGGFFVFDTTIKTSDGQIHYQPAENIGLEFETVPEPAYSATFPIFPDSNDAVSVCYSNLRVCQTEEFESCKPIDGGFFYQEDFTDGSISTNLPLVEGLEISKHAAKERAEELCHAPTS